MSKDKIEVNMNVYDIPILIEELEKASNEIEKLQKENQQLKKQKDDVVEYIKKCQLGVDINDKPYMLLQTDEGKDLLRMLGEIE